MIDLIPQDAFVGLPLWRLALLVHDGEHSEDTALRAHYDEQIKDALDFATKDKADSYAAVIERMGMTITLAKEEIDLRTGKRLLSSGKPYPGDIKRLKDRIQSTEDALEDLTQRALAAMKIMGVKEIAGNTCTLRALGVAPCIDDEGYGESLIPSEFRRVTIKWNGSLREWHERIHASYGQILPPPGVDSTWALLAILRSNVEYSIDKHALLKALKQPCERCGGTGILQLDSYDGGGPIGVFTEHCNACRGIGTRQIPGARLITGRLRLVIE